MMTATPQKMTRKMVWAQLEGLFDTISLRNGVFTVRRGFYYRHGTTAEDKANCVKQYLPTARIIECGEIWAAFRGNASVADQSHWFVKFDFPS